MNWTLLLIRPTARMNFIVCKSVSIVLIFQFFAPILTLPRGSYRRYIECGKEGSTQMCDSATEYCEKEIGGCSQCSLLCARGSIRGDPEGEKRCQNKCPGKFCIYIYLPAAQTRHACIVTIGLLLRQFFELSEIIK